MTWPVIRRYRLEDEPLVLDSWMRQIRGVSPVREWTPEMLDAHRPVLRRLAERYAVVACDPEADWQIYGWAAGTPGVVLMVYVRRVWRMQGVARALVAALWPEGLPGRYVYRTRSAPRLARRWGLVWDPYWRDDASASAEASAGGRWSPRDLGGADGDLRPRGAGALGGAGVAGAVVERGGGHPGA